MARRSSAEDPLGNGRLEISNNEAENQIRPLPLFYTLVRTATLNELEPRHLRDAHRALDRTRSTASKILPPWNMALPATQSVAASQALLKRTKWQAQELAYDRAEKRNASADLRSPARTHAIIRSWIRRRSSECRC